jgi:hypothetical protein
MKSLIFGFIILIIITIVAWVYMKLNQTQK